MADNKILRFGKNAAPSDTLTDSEYQSDDDRPIGHQVGIARNELANKALEQTSTMAAGTAEYAVSESGESIDDSQDTATIASRIKAAVKATITKFMNADNLASVGDKQQSRDNLDIKSEFLQISANLSDVASATQSRAHLGLGSAATKDTGTDASEVPLNSALIGLAYTAQDIPANSDLNDYKTPGYFPTGSNVNTATLSNTPDSSAAGLAVLPSYNSYNIIQIWRTYNNSNIYQRTYYATDDTWYDWQRLVFDSEIGSMAAESVSNYYKKSDYQRSVGGIRSSGYTQLPNGLIIQWDSPNMGTGRTYGSFTLPITFPNALILVVPSDSNTNSNDAKAVVWRYDNSTRSQVAFGSIGEPKVISYIAIGY